MNTAEKILALKKTIAAKGSMLVAFSGGVDSTLLAVIAKEVLGNNTACVLLDSPVISRVAADQAHRIADDLGLLLKIIPVSLMEQEEFRKIWPDDAISAKRSPQDISGSRQKSWALPASQTG